MKVMINGLAEVLPGPLSLAELVSGKGLSPDTVVIEYNRSVLDKEAWAETVVQEGDQIEILRFLGGGC